VLFGFGVLVLFPQRPAQSIFIRFYSCHQLKSLQRNHVTHIHQPIKTFSSANAPDEINKMRSALNSPFLWCLLLSGMNSPV